MPKRKSPKTQWKKREALATTFPCVFCNYENSVTVRMDTEGYGYLRRQVCNIDIETALNALSEVVDVYADWIDACDAVVRRDVEGDKKRWWIRRRRRRRGEAEES